jgi:hypothetical protein
MGATGDLKDDTNGVVELHGSEPASRGVSGRTRLEWREGECSKPKQGTV